MDHETAEEIKRHFNVVAEGWRADIRVVIEGVSANTERLERVEARLDGVEVRLDRVEGRLTGVESGIGAVKAMIRPLIASSDA